MIFLSDQNFKFDFSFFVSAIPDRLFKMMKESEGSKSFKSLVEVNISFVPYESQVGIIFVFSILVAAFSLLTTLTFDNCYFPSPLLMLILKYFVLCVRFHVLPTRQNVCEEKGRIWSTC